jgi:CheY-like chemotaxis protein
MFNHALIIDDDPINNYLCEKILEHSEIVKKVTTFDDPIAAFEFLNYSIENQDFPDLILLDLNMPNLDGWAFLEKYKTLPIEKILETKLCILTSSVDHKNQEKAQQYESISGFFQKPLKIEYIKKISAYNTFNRFMP